MTILWGWFVPGVLLLLFPADRLLSANVELRGFDCFHTLGARARSRPWWWVLSLWLDPIRGFVGTYALHQALAAGYSRWLVISKLEYGLLVAVVAIAVMAQMFTRRADRGVLLAPTGFVAGVVAALAPWTVAVIGIVSGLLGLFGFRQFYAYFVFGAVAIGAIGFVSDVPSHWIVPAAGIFLLPVIAGMVTNSTLELPVREASGRDSLGRNRR